MKDRTLSLLSLILIITLVACNPSAPPMEPTSTPSPEPTETPIVIAGIDEPINFDSFSLQVINSHTEAYLGISPAPVRLPTDGYTFIQINFMPSGLSFSLMEEIASNAVLVCDDFTEKDFYTIGQEISQGEIVYYFIIYLLPEDVVVKDCRFIYEGNDFELATFFD